MVATQTRKTGGILFDLDKVKFVLDPGPGSVVNATSIGILPEKLDGVVLSHFHIDHSTDANVYLDAIEKPFIIAERHCLLDRATTRLKLEYYPCITPFHQKKSEVHAVRDKDVVTIKGITFKAVMTDHYDPAVGFRISGEGLDIGFVADGAYYKGLEKAFEGCQLLIVNAIVPKGQEIDKKYLSVDGVISLVKAMETKPRLVLLNHISGWMLRANLFKQEKIIQDACKVKVIHAEDFMTLDLKTLEAGKVTPKK
jgi:ribonuclease BN (tRNA processing enzyme)